MDWNAVRIKLESLSELARNTQSSLRDFALARSARLKARGTKSSLAPDPNFPEEPFFVLSPGWTVFFYFFSGILRDFAGFSVRRPILPSVLALRVVGQTVVAEEFPGLRLGRPGPEPPGAQGAGSAGTPRASGSISRLKSALRPQGAWGAGTPCAPGSLSRLKSALRAQGAWSAGAPCACRSFESRWSREVRRVHDSSWGKCTAMVYNYQGELLPCGMARVIESATWPQTGRG
jgi:hypothetical protein